MTVCIAAICEKGEAIAVAMDRMISTGHVSADVGFKGVRVHRFWMMMYAGNNIGRVEAIADIAASHLQSKEAPPLAAQTVEQLFAGAFQHESRSEAVNQVLSPYGLDMDTFLSKGREMFGDAVFADVKRQVDDVRLDCQLMITGFGVDQRARLFTIAPPGVAQRYTPVGFWAIGSGASSAIASLMFHGHQTAASRGLALYHVCEAKFMAESAMGVGDSSIVAVFRNDGSMGYLSQENLARVKKLWERHGKPRIPKGIAEEIPGALKWVAPGHSIDEKSDAPAPTTDTPMKTPAKNDD